MLRFMVDPFAQGFWWSASFGRGPWRAPPLLGRSLEDERAVHEHLDGARGQAARVHGDEVGAAEGVYVDELDTGRVHRDLADVAQEAEPAAVRRERELLGRGCAVEAHRVGAAVTALDDVAAVAWIPDEGVVAGTEE